MKLRKLVHFCSESLQFLRLGRHCIFPKALWPPKPFKIEPERGKSHPGRPDMLGMMPSHFGSCNAHLTDRVKSALDIQDATSRAGYIDLIGGRKNSEGKITYHFFDAPALHSDGAERLDVDTFLESKLVMHQKIGWIRTARELQYPWYPGRQPPVYGGLLSSPPRLPAATNLLCERSVAAGSSLVARRIRRYEVYYGYSSYSFNTFIPGIQIR
ncbi:hypothetical protein R3P38DRAFT_2815608 [Favolaschia claudopus]|uniref:Uncharacterized protein n=1 Tax=Favolaschia claudopus TaxID=2862362 RepID=A0AAV9Z0V6_9AGAR